MNLTQLWAGNDYVYYPMRGRNENFRSNGQRVRVIRTFKQKMYGNERDSGFAHVQYLNDDGTPKLSYADELIYGDVKARDIFSRWEEYEDERNHRAERVAKEAAEREQRAAAENAKKEELITTLVDKHNIPRTWITSITDFGIVLHRPTVEKELLNTDA